MYRSENLPDKRQDLSFAGMVAKEGQRKVHSGTAMPGYHCFCKVYSILDRHCQVPKSRGCTLLIRCDEVKDVVVVIDIMVLGVN